MNEGFYGGKVLFVFSGTTVPSYSSSVRACDEAVLFGGYVGLLLAMPFVSLKTLWSISCRICATSMFRQVSSHGV